MALALVPAPRASSQARWARSGLLRPPSVIAALVGLILFGTLGRGILAAVLGLGFGEAYHFSCALRPNLSYFDHPPMALWLGHLAMKLSGSTEPLVLRLPFVAMFAASTLLVFDLSRRWFGSWPGFYAALLMNLSAVFTVSVGGFLQSDGPLVFFWLACVWCLSRLFFESPAHPMLWWLAVGATLGGCLLSKYHAVFLVFGAAMFALTDRTSRRWIRHPGPYVAMVLAMAIFSPVLIWNAQNGWISFLWQGNRALESHGIRWDWLLRNVGGQALWVLPWIWGPLLWELPRCFRAGPADRVRWFLAWMAVGPIVLFTLVSSYANIGFHFHWQAPGYLMLFPALGATLHQRLVRGHRVSRWWLQLSTVFTVGSALLLATHCTTGWWRASGPQWLSKQFGEPDDPTLELLDFHPLENALRRYGLWQRPDLFLFTNRWFQSGKVDFAVRGQMPVLCFHPFDPRSYAFWDRPEDWVGKDGVLVSTKKFLDDPKGWYGDYFASIRPLPPVPVTRAGHVEETLYLYLCERHLKPFPRPYP